MSDLNDKTARKIGEALAFAKCGIETFEKAETALKEVLGDDYDSFIVDNNNFIKKISDIAGEYEVTETVDTKADKTLEKLTKMRDMYIGDEWDDAVEIFEWHGFFFGAGMVHWALVEGAARNAGVDELTTLAEEGVAFYHEQLMSTISNIKMQGRNIS